MAATLRVRATIEGSHGWTAKVIFDYEYAEYQVWFLKNGRELIPSRYFTDDFEDAVATAKHEMVRMN